MIFFLGMYEYDFEFLKRKQDNRKFVDIICCDKKKRFSMFSHTVGIRHTKFIN